MRPFPKLILIGVFTLKALATQPVATPAVPVRQAPPENSTKSSSKHKHWLRRLCGGEVEFALWFSSIGIPPPEDEFRPKPGRLPAVVREGSKTTAAHGSSQVP